MNHISRPCICVIHLGIVLLSILFTPVNSSLAKESVVQKCRNILLSTKPKLGLPSEKYQNFDIRIESTWLGQSPWESQDLLNTAVAQIDEFQSKLHDLGFGKGHYLNVLVEKHPEAVTCGWGEAGTCLAIGPLAFMETPGIAGRSLFVGSSHQKGQQDSDSRILVLKALSEEYHSVFSPFTVAHELAHNTELSGGSTKSLIWVEARADYLAYILTDEPEVKFPAGHPPYQYDQNGKKVPSQMPSQRSLIAPSISRKSQLIPNRGAYHENSEVLSSLLFRLGEEFGSELPIDFIKWMDHSGKNRILTIEEALAECFGCLAVEDGTPLKEAWEKVIDSFLLAIENWSMENTSTGIHSWLQSEILKINHN